MSMTRASALKTLTLLLVLGAPAIAAATEDGSPEPLRKGDRIVFLGDSITAGALGKGGYISVIREALEEKHKDLGVECIGAGISGNKVPDLQRRLDRDVIARKPTVVVIYIGINDVWHGESDPAKGTSKEAFESGLKEIIGKCQDAGARVILCTPSVIGEKHDGTNALDGKLDEYSEVGRKVAKELKVGLCGLRAAFLAYEKAHNANNKESNVLTGDRVHLNEAGNKLVAETMLKSLGG